MQSVVVLPPQSTAVDYSLREEPQRLRARQSTLAMVDLGEWCGTRVLALRDSRYYPGVIRNASHGEVFIEFDGEGKLAKYMDVFGAGKYDVIGDAIPSLEQVTLDAKVCFKCPTPNGHIDAMTNVFVRGTVCKIFAPTKRFSVKIPTDGDQSDSYVVKRADLRLLQPPWVDELEDVLKESEPMRPESVGKIKSSHDPPKVQ